MADWLLFLAQMSLCNRALERLPITVLMRRGLLFNSDASLRELIPGTESLYLLPAGLEEVTFLILSINA
jgi:hypothetical protein